MKAREAQLDQGTTSHASTTISWAIGPRSVPIPKKNSNQNQGNQKQANPKARPGYMHYIAMEEIPMGEVVTTSMFLVNKYPDIVLFDSRASHSFMSKHLHLSMIRR